MGVDQVWYDMEKYQRVPDDPWMIQEWASQLLRVHQSIQGHDGETNTDNQKKN